MSTTEIRPHPPETANATEPRLSLDLAGTLMSSGEFDDAIDWDEAYRYELTRGVLIVSPSPSISERNPNEYLGTILRLYQWNHPQGSALDFTIHEHTLRFGEERRRADRAIWTGLGRMPQTETELPSIVVELVSRGRRDRLRDYVEKRALYLASGIREYWVFDRFLRSMTVFRQAEDLRVGEAETYRTPLLPGFDLEMPKLLAEANRFDAK